MRLKLVTAPAAEPLDLETEVKAHLRVDIADDDLFIAGLMAGAREFLEEAARRAFVTQTWRLNLDGWPDDSDEIELPRPPLQSVSSITYTDSEGNETTWSSDEYLVDTDSEPGRIVVANGYSWPGASLRSMNPIQITYVAGYGDPEDVPQRWKRAMLLLIGHWYENREVIVATGAIPKEIPLAVDSLIWLDRG